MAPEYVRGLSYAERIQTFRCWRRRLFACYGLDPRRRIFECVVGVSVFRQTNFFSQMVLLRSMMEVLSSNDL